MRQILKFVRLPSIEQWLLVKSAFLLVVVRLGLFLFSFKTLLDFINTVKPKNRDRSNADNMAPDRIAWAVTAASRYIPFTRCLSKAMVAQILFARLGYPAKLRIGVLKSDKGQLEAHAWVESQGRIVIGNLEDISRFSMLSSLES